MANTNAFYQVIMRGISAGQSVLNILYYRLGFDIIPGDFNLAGAGALAAGVKATIWDGFMKPRLVQSYTLQSIDVVSRDTDFNLLHQMPYVLSVNETGQTAGANDGPAQCLIVHANLVPTAITQGFFPPSRGYWAIGPINSDEVSNGGALDAASLNTWNNQAQALSATIVSVLPPATFEPIKLKTTRLLGGVVLLNGWADIASVSVRQNTSFRRSRVPRAS